MSKVATYPVVLTSRRLLLRPPKIAEAAGLARMTNDPLVTRNLLKTAMPFTTADARELILRARKRKSPVWAIDTGQLVGLIGHVGEFGYWLGRSAWGKGFASEAAKKLGFERNGIARAFCCQRSRVVPLIRYKLERLTWEKAQSRDRT